MNDLAHWDVATSFTGAEAAALAVGLDPSQADHNRARRSPMIERMKRSYASKRQWYEDNERPQPEELDSVPLNQMLESRELAWRARTEEDDALQEWLRNERQSGFDSQTFAREEIARWLAEIGLTSAYLFSKPKSGGSPGLKEESFLKIVIAMAVRGYGFDPSASKSPISKQIADDAALLGISIDEDTVRKYLKLSADLLPSMKMLENL